MSTIDLNNTGGKGKLEWASCESAAEEAARLAREVVEASHELRVRWWTFVSCLTALFVVGLTGLGLLFFGGTPERERVGTVFLTAIVSGAIGFLSGKAARSK